jgi:DNA-binding NarL/FixJ family response regulator
VQLDAGACFGGNTVPAARFLKLYSIGYYDAALGLFARSDALKAAGLREEMFDIQIVLNRTLSAMGGPAVLVLTMHEDDESLFAAIRAGACGYLLKGASRSEVVAAVIAVAEGGAVFGPGIARRVLALCSTGAPGSSPRTPFPALTEREREVLVLLAQGMGNHNIAAQLTLSPKTVRNHVSSILGKLHASTRGEAMIKAQ